MLIGTNGVIIDELAQVLLIRRNDTRTIAPPGGSLESGELPPDSLAREVREETGLVVMPVRLVGLYFLPLPPDGMLAFVFRCIQRGGQLSPTTEAPVVAFFPSRRLPGPMLPFHLPDQFLRGDIFLFCLEHDGRPMGVVSTYIDAIMAAHFLKTHPDIRLDIFHQVSDMDWAIGIGQGTGYQNFS